MTFANIEGVWRGGRLIIRDKTTGQDLLDVEKAIGGIAGGLGVRTGTVTGTATPSVTTTLNTVNNVVLVPRADTATKINACAGWGWAPQASTPGAFDVFRWKHTGATTPTFIAATVAGTLDYIAFGNEAIS